MPASTPFLVHWDEAPAKQHAAGDIQGRWTLLGEACGSVNVGLRRIQLEPGFRSTPPHAHGAEEEIFYVLGGSGLLWQDGAVCEVGPGDCIVHGAEGAAHTLRGGDGGLDVLAFGTRVMIELCYLPRAGMAWGGPTVVAAPGLKNLWENDAAAGPLHFPPPGPRPANVVRLDQVEPMVRRRGETRLLARFLPEQAGSKRSGLNHFLVEPGGCSWPLHCHGAEEEIFVVLDGQGVLILGDDEHPVRAGHVVSRPPGTGIAHQFRAGPSGLILLAYGTREPNDIAYYPKSGKVFLRGIGVIGKIDPLPYWDDDPIG